MSLETCPVNTIIKTQVWPQISHTPKTINNIAWTIPPIRCPSLVILVKSIILSMVWSWRIHPVPVSLSYLQLMTVLNLTEIPLLKWRGISPARGTSKAEQCNPTPLPREQENGKGRYTECRESNLVMQDHNHHWIACPYPIGPKGYCCNIDRQKWYVEKKKKKFVLCQERMDQQHIQLALAAANSVIINYA